MTRQQETLSLDSLQERSKKCSVALFPNLAEYVSRPHRFASRDPCVAPYNCPQFRSVAPVIYEM